jgi:hypothetical protein
MRVRPDNICEINNAKPLAGFDRVTDGNHRTHRLDRRYDPIPVVDGDYAPTGDEAGKQNSTRSG